MPNHDEPIETMATIMHPSSPVKWTPEDAANFIGATIREAQRPTMEAIRRRGVSKFFYALTCLFFIVLLGAAGYYIFYLTQKLDAAQTQSGAGLDDKVTAVLQAGGDKVNAAGERVLAAGDKVTAAAAVLAQSVKTGQDLIDAARLREQLDAARKENAAQAFALDTQKAQTAALAQQLAGAEEKEKTLTANLAALTETVNQRQTEITTIDQYKQTTAAEIEKLKQAVALRETALAEQKEEIVLLRKRLDTAQAMLGNSGAATAPVEVAAPVAPVGVGE